MAKMALVRARGGGFLVADVAGLVPIDVKTTSPLHSTTSSSRQSLCDGRTLASRWHRRFPRQGCWRRSLVPTAVSSWRGRIINSALDHSLNIFSGNTWQQK